MKGKAEPMNMYFLTRKPPEISIESPTASEEMELSGVVGSGEVGMESQEDSNSSAGVPEPKP